MEVSWKQCLGHLELLQIAWRKSEEPQPKLWLTLAINDLAAAYLQCMAPLGPNSEKSASHGGCAESDSRFKIQKIYQSWKQGGDRIERTCRKVEIHTKTIIFKAL